MRGSRGFSGLVLVAAVVATGVACQPIEGDLNVSTVAITTDQTATDELNRQNANVAWLSCNGTFSSSSPSGSATSGEVKVECRGKTKDGKDITVEGWVYGVVSGKCVRGKVIGRIDNKVWFSVGVLGNCAASDSTSPPQDSQQPAPSEDPKPQEPQPGATGTITETVTVTAPPPTFQGK
ncbi:hypothetical protein OG785_24210 [Streptomyces sp. NBC_00006]|uniref:hypothetical protein n=1 Tax=unclassified Streptomyces TaxID=2593676 RepID=UPI00225B30F9|nr:MULTISPECIES: hypothetical protein [unclassified Streptomyces]MCX4832651.1 hypothetical protein [Streptomyces sp. NBC_01016]MCX5533642.1 hypothetical protein [Streptomyces sp. NBC_00006]